MFSNGGKTGSRKTRMREERRDRRWADSLGTVAHTSQLDFHGIGYKCQLPYLKRFGCSGWCLSHCRGRQCQSEGHGGSGYTASEHGTPQKTDQTWQSEAEYSVTAPQQGQDEHSGENSVSGRSLAHDEVRGPCCCPALPAQVHVWEPIRENLKIGVFTALPLRI